MKNKKLLTIVLVFLVLLLGGASVYVATQMSTRQAVAPTAPESKPKAFEMCGSGLNCSPNQITGATQCTMTTVAESGDFWCCPADKTIVTGACVDYTWVGSDACTVTASASAVVCVPSGVVTCNPDCPTACGTAASTITTCTNSCGTATTKTCAATVACSRATLEGNKTAYKNVTSNTPGNYSLTTIAETVSKSQIYVYTIELKNTSETTASGVVVKDTIVDLPVTFMDTVAGCTFSSTNKELTCNTSITPDQTKKFSFRVKATDSIVNGTVISNTARVSYPDGSLDLTKDLAVSTVVGCNHTCTTTEECSTGLTCDTTTSKCRTTACLTEDDCTCAVAVVPTTRVTVTAAPRATATATATASPTRVITAAATPTILPETGIFDLPGIAAFGGGLLLAVVGILLAL